MRRIRAVIILAVLCASALAIITVPHRRPALEEIRAIDGPPLALAIPGPLATLPPPPTTTTTSPPVTTTTAPKPVKALRSAPATTAAPEVRGSPPGPSGDVYDRLAQCESGMRNLNTGNGYYGYFQFLPSTWRSMGETGLPTDHDYATQKAAAIRLIQRSGWGQFPACGRKLGMR